MSDLSFELQTKLLPVLRAGQLDECERRVAGCMAGLPTSPFHSVLEVSFTNRPEEVAAHFDGFVRREAKRFRIRAVYAEMNGFDINARRWFFDVFAFNDYGGHDDYDWLADWASENYPELTLTGLEALQRVYASDAFRDAQFKDAAAIAGLLVVIKFQDLIRRAVPFMREVKFPVLATAHDYDFIYEAQPDSRG
jgi:hypothetical protein